MNEMSKGETDLGTLIRSMQPRIRDGGFVFCSLSLPEYQQRPIEGLGAFREDEGMTVILERAVAEREELPFSGVWSQITCTVHSDLEAVGFLAAISEALARAGISVNVVSGFYHDHCFVRTECAARALEVLEALSREWTD